MSTRHRDANAPRARRADSGRLGGVTELYDRSPEHYAHRGPEHPDTLTARANLAATHRQAGRTVDADAIAIEEQVAAASERILGPEHPSTSECLRDLREWKR